MVLCELNNQSPVDSPHTRVSNAERVVNQSIHVGYSASFDNTTTHNLLVSGHKATNSLASIPQANIRMGARTVHEGYHY